MLYVLSFVIALCACTIGTVCGMGGGIIIKPLLDATGLLSVSTITFLSGCTVIAMSLWNVVKTFIKKESDIELKTTTFLAIGAALGGLSGKMILNAIIGLVGDKDAIGGIQAVLLLAATVGTFIYTVNKDKIRSKQITSPIVCVIIGLLLGILGSFLGIGGGPFNVAVLYYFFSMKAKKAAQNSLYIILFSQGVSTMKTVVSGNIPEFSIIILICMIVASILGSEIGRKINKRIDNSQATKWLEGIMIVIMLINIWNIIKYLIL